MYDPRLGRWLSVDPLRHKSPNYTPYRFGFNNPITFKDPNGQWEEDGHFWTVYAFGIAMGLKNEDARKLAVAAEAFDHKVDGDNNMTITPSPIYPTLSWGKDGGLGTWSVPILQRKWHGLTGGPQSEVIMDATNEILMNENFLYLHKLGDAYAHSYVDGNGNAVMYGKVGGENEPWWAPIARWGLVGGGDATFEHAFAGPDGHEKADNIADRGVEYKAYINNLLKVYSDPKFKIKGQLNNQAPNLAIFDYVQKNGKTKENNIFLLSSYISIHNGQSSFSKLSCKQLELLKGYLDSQKIEYNITTQKEMHINGLGKNDYYETEVHTLEIKK